MSLINVKFLRAVGPYNAGERAGFTSHQLERIRPECFEILKTEGEAGSKSSASDELSPIVEGDAPSEFASPASDVAAPDQPEADRAVRSPRKKRSPRRGR